MINKSWILFACLPRSKDGVATECHGVLGFFYLDESNGKRIDEVLKLCDSDIKDLSALYAAEGEEETDATTQSSMPSEVKALRQMHSLACLLRDLRSGNGADPSGPSTSKKK